MCNKPNINQDKKKLKKIPVQVNTKHQILCSIFLPTNQALSARSKNVKNMLALSSFRFSTMSTLHEPLDVHEPLLTPALKAWQPNSFSKQPLLMGMFTSFK